MSLDENLGWESEHPYMGVLEELWGFRYMRLYIELPGE